MTHVTHVAGNGRGKRYCLTLAIPAPLGELAAAIGVFADAAQEEGNHVEIMRYDDSTGCVTQADAYVCSDPFDGGMSLAAVATYLSQIEWFEARRAWQLNEHTPAVVPVLSDVPYAGVLEFGGPPRR